MATRIRYVPVQGSSCVGRYASGTRLPTRRLTQKATGFYTPFSNDPISYVAWRYVEFGILTSQRLAVLNREHVVGGFTHLIGHPVA